MPCFTNFYTDPEWLDVRATTNAGFEMIEENNLILMRPHAAFAKGRLDFTQEGQAACTSWSYKEPRLARTRLLRNF